MMKKNNLYEMQHKIWPSWSSSTRDAKRKVDFLIKWLRLRGQESILDVGCGVGKEIILLGKLGYHCKGIDISEKLIQIAKDNAKKYNLEKLVQFEQGDIRKKFVNQSFDIILLLDSTVNIFPLKEIKKIISLMANSLNNKGKIIVEQLNYQYWDKDVEFTIQSKSVGPGKTFRKYSYDDRTSTLTDKIIYVDNISGQKEELPTQHLRLLKPDEIENIFIKAGLSGIVTIGSAGSNWKIPPISRSFSNSMSLITLGEKAFGSNPIIR